MPNITDQMTKGKKEIISVVSRECKSNKLKKRVYQLMKYHNIYRSVFSPHTLTSLVALPA